MLATERRQHLVATKSMNLAQHNENVSTVAEQQKQRTLAEVTNAKSANVEKIAKAEEKRNAAVAKIVDNARTRTSRAAEGDADGCVGCAQCLCCCVIKHTKGSSHGLITGCIAAWSQLSIAT